MDLVLLDLQALALNVHHRLLSPLENILFIHEVTSINAHDVLTPEVSSTRQVVILNDVILASPKLAGAFLFLMKVQLLHQHQHRTAHLRRP